MITVTFASATLSAALFCVGLVLHDEGFDKVISLLAFVPLLHHLFEKFFDLDKNKQYHGEFLCIVSISVGIALIGYFTADT